MSFPALAIEQRQSRTLSPRMQRAVRLLQMSSIDFAQEVSETLGRNPFLESDSDSAPERGDDGQGAAGEGASVTRSDGAGSATPAHEGDAGPSFAADDTHFDDAPGWPRERAASRRPDDGDGDGYSALDTMVAETSLAGHLHAQLQLVALPKRDLLLAQAVVDSLDDDGYLRTELDELLGVTALDPPASSDELLIALRRVQSLEPAGVAARSVQECLALQLPAIGCPEQRALAREVVLHHLPALAANDVLGLARRLGRPAVAVEAACERIRRLQPRPGWRYGGGRIDYVTPDVIVRKTRGAWRASVNPAIVPAVRLNRTMADLYRRHHKAKARIEPSPELAACLQEAQWTVRNVGQRLATIATVAQAIVDRQRNFLDYGAMAMRPLGLAEIAAAVGLHESTVSRVTNNKYMATPSGVFELKYFFSRELATAAGGACSATAIRSLIGDLIAAEPAAAPLSDADIARQLAQQGLVIARRTVTKYRQLLRIEPAERRRRLGPA
jgi:RNA polymerase sigma-54 factor